MGQMGHVPLSPQKWTNLHMGDLNVGQKNGIQFLEHSMRGVGPCQGGAHGWPDASWLRQVESYLRDTGKADLSSAWAMARRRPEEYRRKVDAATHCSGVRPHTWPDLTWLMRGGLSILERLMKSKKIFLQKNKRQKYDSPATCNGVRLNVNFLIYYDKKSSTIC